MTVHRLIRSTPSDLLACATGRHAGQLDSSDWVGTEVVGWRYGPDASADRTARWRSPWPDGSVLLWCLEVEQGANGALAHLSAAAESGPLQRLPPVVRRLALQTCSGHELTRLGRRAETSAATPADRFQDPSWAPSR